MRKIADNTAEAIKNVKDGQSIMIGGFIGCGTPEGLISALIERPVKDIVLIANDTATPEKGIGRLIAAKLVNEAWVSHIGTNKETIRQLNEKETVVNLIPQGTLAEKIRCAGAGIGGFLTPTGVGTAIEEGKAVHEIDGKKYLLETPLHADVALLKAWKADVSGNLVFRRTARNFNPIMALAADLVVAEVEEIVPTGSLDPDSVIVPGVVVDKIVLSPETGGI